MSEHLRVQLTDVSKRYNIYARPVDRLREIVLRNSRCYHKEFWALSDINLNFYDGCTAIIGPNGSGKSTLLQIIAGVVQPTTGHVNVRGRLTAILELGAGFKPDYTGRENVLMNGMILGISKKDMEAKMEEIADFAELGDFFDQPIKTYSSGMVVRLAFSSAISVDPEILLVDEALAVGDQRFQVKCRDKIWELRHRGTKTIIFVSHSMDVVRFWCDRAVVFNGGRTIMQGPVEEAIEVYESMMNEENFQIHKEFVTPTLAHTS